MHQELIGSFVVRDLFVCLPLLSTGCISQNWSKIQFLCIIKKSFIMEGIESCHFHNNVPWITELNDRILVLEVPYR